jgi:hypothetical protein
LGSRLSRRIKNPAFAFGISLTILGILGVFYVNGLDMWQTKLASSLVAATHKMWETAYMKTLFYPIFSSFFLFVIPALSMGIGFPFALQAWSNYRHKVGQTTGTVYGANTIGAVLGGLLVGFLFIPLAGVQGSIVILGLTGIWFGCIMMIVYWFRIKIIWKVLLLSIAICFTVIALTTPSDLFRKQFVHISGLPTKVLAIEEGLNTTASVHEDHNGNRILATSNVKVAGDRPGFCITQKMLGHVGCHYFSSIY